LFVSFHVLAADALPALLLVRLRSCCYCCLCVYLCLQLWYVVPPAQHQRFGAALQQHMGLPDLSTAAGLAAVKTLLPLLPAEAVRALGVRRLLQKPGDIVLTCPVSECLGGDVTVWVCWWDALTRVCVGGCDGL
jgi:hypothetical protein